MYSSFTPVIRAVSFSLIVSLIAGPIWAAGNTDTSKLRDDVTLTAIRDHQAAFQAIADANGDTRHAGSTGFDASADYVVEQLEAAGYDLTLQPFTFPYFEELSTAEFRQIAPNPTDYDYFSPTGFATMTYSPSGDVTAAVQGVDITIPPGANANTSTSGCESSDFSGFVPGNIALIQRGSCTFQTKVYNADNAGAVGVIIFNEGQTGRTDNFLGTLSSPVANIPAITTSYGIGEDLYNLSMGPGVTVRIFVDTISEYRPTLNVLAELPGHYDRVLMAGAHLDSVNAGPGINDNGSGAATLLEIALQMAQPQHKPRNTIRFAWWGAEEGGLSGSNYYVASLGIDNTKKLVAYLELEMLGSPNFVRFVFDGDGSDGPVAGPEGSAIIEQIINDYFADQGLPAEPTPIDSRHSYLSFFNAGVPIGGLFGGDAGIKTAQQAATFGGTAGEQYDPCYHLACDTFDNVSLNALDQMSDAAAHVIQTLSMRGTSTATGGPGRLTCEELGYDFSLTAEPDGCRQSSGFWKSSPGAWPVESIEIGGVVYSKAEAIAIMSAKAKGDKTYALFIETVATKLNNVTCGPFPEDIGLIISAADAWLAQYPPGSGVKSKDSEWDNASLLYAALSSFNAGSFISGTWDLDGLVSVTVDTVDGIYFDWTSTRSADAVIVKGGRNVNLYEYDPESFGDIGLHAPINNKNDMPYGLSYIEFCFDYDINVSVQKFNDLNNNGIWDEGEPEIGVDQFVLPDGRIGGTTGWPYLFTYPTNTGGFTDMFWTPGTHEHSNAGNYYIAEQEFILWDPTALYINNTPQSVLSFAEIPYAGDADESYEVIFGNVGYAEILGKKFEDLNASGAYDAGEPPVQGVEITLDGTDILGDPVLLTTITDVNGEFAFLNLVPGTYTATETDWPPGGWTPSTSPVSGPHILDSGDSLDLEQVFGNFLPGSIHGYKFIDVNGNGVEDDNEPRLAGVIIMLTGDVDGDGDIDSVQQTTDGNGEYWFVGLVPGNYTVEEIVPDGWIAVTPTSADVTVVSGIELVAEAGQAMLSPEQIAAGYEEVIDEVLVFGNLQYGSIHGYKFDDLDGNGIDDGEPRVPGVTINLVGDVNGDGVFDQVSVTTDANGEYGFTDLYPGDYEVSEETPPGWIPTTPTSTNVTVNSGEELVALPGQSQLPPGSTKIEVVVGDLLSFGNFQLGSIHGYKFDDLDADGVWSPGEPRLAGWTFQLVDSDGDLVGEQVSDDAGNYVFTDLGPDSYTVTEVAMDGWNPSTPSPPPLFVQSGQEYVAEPGLAQIPPESTKYEVVEPLLAFGNFQTGSIHGFKFEDLNGNGLWNPEEPMMEGITFELIDADGNIIATEVTNPDGEYWFLEIVPGAYSVSEIVPDDGVASTENPVHLLILSGQEHVAVDGMAQLPPESTKIEVLEPRLAFGNFRYASVEGYKFEDLNANGIHDAGEPGMPNVEVILDGVDGKGNPLTLSDVTDDTGAFYFDNVVPGHYVVTEIIPAGMVPSTPESSGPHILQSGETLDLGMVFGNYRHALIIGYKFEDANANGTHDGGEGGLAGITVNLNGVDGFGNTVNESIETGLGGEFHFLDLIPGEYTVTEIVPAGMVPSTPESSGPHVLQSGEALDLGMLFGNYATVLIIGHKFEDANANGIHDGGEGGLAGITVNLDGVDGFGNAVNESTVTGLMGEFNFFDITPGEYTITEIVPAGMVPSTPEFTGPLSLYSGEVRDLGMVFGNYFPASIDGFKFEDLNANGVRDADEPGVAGIEVTLTGTDGQGNAINDLAVTDVSGGFSFSSLTPGIYTVTETVPAGWEASTPPSSGPYNLVSNQTLDLGMVFGNFMPAELTGNKFDDLNANGVLDAGEPPLADILVTLTGTDGMGNAVYSDTLTGADGAFGFTGLRPGVYTVTETVPAGWEASTPVSSGPHLLQSGDLENLGWVFGNYLANLPPTANPAGFNATGNVGINVAAPGVLVNATDPNSPPQPLTATIAVDAATDQNGTVNISANGSFTYDPPAGFIGSDTFNYEVCDDAAACDSGQITITISDMIWFIDNSASAGDGTLASPFNSIAQFETSVLPAVNDCIFIDETSNGAYTGPLTLANGQVLVGKGSVTGTAIVCGITLASDSDPLPVTGGTRPVIVNPAGNGIVLASGNTVRGLNVGDTTGIGISGSGVGTASVSEVSILGNGAALGISTGTIAMDFDEVSSTATGNEGIFLSAVQGSLEIMDGTISTSGATAIDITGTGPGVTLNVMLESVSASGGVNGIILDPGTTTGSLFMVTGTGGDCKANAANCSGGTISNMSGIAVDIDDAQDVSLTAMQITGSASHGITLDDVDGFFLDNSRVTNNGTAAGEQGIRARELSGSVDVTDNLFQGNYEDHLEVENSTDTFTSVVTVTGNLFDANHPAGGNNGINYASRNGPSRTVTFDIRDNTFQNIRATAIQIDAETGATHDITIGGAIADGNTFNNNNVAVNVTNGFSGDVIASVDNNIMTNHGSSGAGHVINLFTSTTAIVGSTFNATVSDNQIGISGLSNSGTPNGHAVRIIAQGHTEFNALVDNNTVHGVANGAIEAQARDGQATLNFTMDNNTLNLENSFGVYVYGVGNTAADAINLCADIDGNTIVNTETSPGSGLVFSGVSVQQGESGGGTAVFTLPNLVAPVETFIDSQNTISTPGAGFAVNVYSTGTFSAGGTSCTLP